MSLRCRYCGSFVTGNKCEFCGRVQDEIEVSKIVKFSDLNSSCVPVLYKMERHLWWLSLCAKIWVGMLLLGVSFWLLSFIGCLVVGAAASSAAKAVSNTPKYAQTSPKPDFKPFFDAIDSEFQKNKVQNNSSGFDFKDAIRQIKRESEVCELRNYLEKRMISQGYGLELRQRILRNYDQLAAETLRDLKNKDTPYPQRQYQ